MRPSDGGNIASIGQVTRQRNSFKGHIKTLGFRAGINIVPNPDKKADNHPDYRVLSQGAEVGAGWTRKSESTGNEYVSLSLADPSFGPKKLYAKPGRFAGQYPDDANAWQKIDIYARVHSVQYEKSHGAATGNTVGVLLQKLSFRFDFTKLFVVQRLKELRRLIPNSVALPVLPKSRDFH